MLDMVIKGGKIVTPEGIVSAGIAVEAGKIVMIAADQKLPDGTQTINVGDRYILPGLVDPETHAGHDSTEIGFQNETKAALASGITTWGFMLSGRSLSRGAEETPLISKVFPAFQRLGDQHSRVDYFYTPIFATDEQVLEIPELAKRFGITSFKYYLHMMEARRFLKVWPAASTLGIADGFDDGMVYLGLELTSRLGPPGIVLIHPENWEIARIFEDRLKKAGRKDMAAWDERSPHFCEAGHVRTYAYYAKVTNCPLYIIHVTTEETIKEILQARADGVRIFGQTSTCYLSLSHDVWKINVPLRDRETMEKLWQALRDRIVCTGTDHVHVNMSRQEMEKEDVWSTMSGFPSRVEAHLPVLLSEGVNKGRISLPQMVRASSEDPAKIFGLYPKKGAIQIGSDADFVVIDLNLTRKVTNDMVLSSTGWTIYDGWEMKGWPVMVILRGDVVMEWPKEEIKPKIIGAPKGRYIPRVPGHVAYPLDR